jgi:hypothetical protein
MVYRNATIEHLASSLPSTLEELLEAPYLGPARVQRFGRDILDAIEHSRDPGSPPPPALRRERDWDLQEALPAGDAGGGWEGEPSPEQASALARILKARGCALLTGGAGTGKSFVLSRVLGGLPGPSFAVAPTAVAARLHGGATLHSFFMLPPNAKPSSLPRALSRLRANRPKLARVLHMQALVIDEVSMVPAGLLTLVDGVLRELRDPGLPFGGVKVVACGDFFQLPPVSKGERGGQPEYAFLSPAWKEAGFEECTVTLTNPERQGEGEFQEVRSTLTQDPQPPPPLPTHR